MALVFIDSFDPYDALLTKWSSGEANFNTNPTFVRTGTQSLNPTAPGFGAQPRVNFGVREVLIAGVAYYPTGFGAGGGNQIMAFFSEQYGAVQFELDVNANGSLSLKNANTTFATSAPGVISINSFFYLEMMADIIGGGLYEVRVNGVTALSGAFGALPVVGADGFFLFAAPSDDQYFDDLYICDDTGGVNDSFLGAVQIFAILPDLDETPLQWTPLSGTNVSNVNTAPPPGDASYVFSNTPTDVDQYHYTITGPAGDYAIKGIQHSLSARLDAAGSHIISSQINATSSGSPQVGGASPGADYGYAIFPWDQNPNTGQAFQPTDFATTFVGPKLTS